MDRIHSPLNDPGARSNSLTAMLGNVEDDDDDHDEREPYDDEVQTSAPFGALANVVLGKSFHVIGGFDRLT